MGKEPFLCPTAMLWAYTTLEAHLPVCQQAVSVWCSSSYRDVHTSLLFTAPLFIQHSWPPSLTWDSTMGGQPGLTTSHEPLFPNSSQSPQPATPSPSMQFCPLSFFPQPHLSSFHRKKPKNKQLGRDERFFCQQV